MSAIRSILVAVKDADTKQLPVVAKAAQLARCFGASLELFHAISEPVYAGFQLTEQSLQELKSTRVAQHLIRLEGLAAQFRGPEVRISTSAAWDFPAHESIVRRAIEVKADLIVAACHDGRRLTPWLMHLTDWELLRTSPMPVLLVRTEEPYERPIVLAAVDPRHAHAKPSSLDLVVLDTASHITRALSGSLHAMHAYFPVPLDVPASDILTDEQAGRLYTKIEKRARSAFEKCAARAHIPRARRHLVKKNPVIAIPEVAKEVGTDILVMGAVSRSGLKRIFIGNTAERVLGHVRCDVLVVKPRRFARRIVKGQRGVRLVAQQLPSVYF
ncbi:MAG: universal stress protein [Gammaproteobacteria bacterium]